MNNQSTIKSSDSERRLLEDAESMRLPELDMLFRLPEGYHFSLGVIEPDGDRELSVVRADRQGETLFDRSIAVGEPADIEHVAEIIRDLAESIQAARRDHATRHAPDQGKPTAMSLGESVGHAIHGICAERGMSIRTLAALLDEPYTGFSTRLNHGRLTLADIDGMALALGMRFWDVIDRAKLVTGNAFIAAFDDSEAK